jgi:DNA-binding transcriptional LysR family regulator
MNRRLDLNDLRLLLKVVEQGSFTAAAAAAGIPVSTISQRIASLENFAGVGLLRRTTRSLSLTEAGSALLPHARLIESEARQAEIALLDGGKELKGILRISSSFALAEFALAPIVPDFLRESPGVSIRVEVTNRYVDLIGEGYDLCLRAHAASLRDSSLRQRTAAVTPWSLVASSNWVAKHGQPSQPADLAGLDTLFFAIPNAPAMWSLSKKDEEVKINLTPRLWSDDIAMLRRAAIESGGIASLPQYITQPLLKAGQLVPILAGWLSGTSKVSILTPLRSQTSRLAAAFSDFLARELRRTTEPENVSKF